MGKQSRQARLFGGSNPPSLERWRTTSTSALWRITRRELGAVHVRAWSWLVEESGVWQAQVTFGAPVGRLGMPATEGDLKERVGHGEGGRSWEGLQEGRGSSASDATEACEGDLAHNGGGVLRGQQGFVGGVGHHCRMHTLRPCKEAFDVCCVELCMCVGFNCLDHLPRVGPDGTEVLVQRGGEGPEVFWVFGRGCLCQGIGRQVSGGVVQGRGLADTESAVPEGESKLRLGLGGSGPQDLLGGGRDGVVYLVYGTLYGFSGAVQWGGAGQVPAARDQEASQQEELILAREGEVREAVDEGQHHVFPLLEVSFRVGLGANGGARHCNTGGGVWEAYHRSNVVASVRVRGPDGAFRQCGFQANGLCLGAKGLDCVREVVGSPL
jgi:hypothetical protein